MEVSRQGGKAKSTYYFNVAIPFKALEKSLKEKK
jgi:hypothetical protein